MACATTCISVNSKLVRVVTTARAIVLTPTLEVLTVHAQRTLIKMVYADVIHPVLLLLTVRTKLTHQMTVLVKYCATVTVLMTGYTVSQEYCPEQHLLTNVQDMAIPVKTIVRYWTK